MHRTTLSFGALVCAGCATTPQMGLPEPLPPLLVEQVVAPRADSVAATTAEVPRITFTAAGAPVRDMLALIAQAAGVTLVLDSTVTGRVSFHFEDVPALEALEQVARSAGYELAFSSAGPTLPFVPRTVFFRAPVNVDQLDVSGIRTHFDVSRELAEWLVWSRHPRVNR